MYLDADAHVDECEETWSFMPPELAPRTLCFEPEEIPPYLVPTSAHASAQTRFWFMDGQIHTRRFRSDERTGTTTATRELRDVAGRVVAMDELGIGTQVLYPTLFLHELTRRKDLDLALCRSYNRWIAERCSASGERLRWVALPPLGSIEDTVVELRWAAEHGAVGVFKRGIEWDRAISDPYFFPLYETAEALGLPVCVHSSLPYAPIEAHFSRVRLPFSLGFGGITVVQAVYALVADDIPGRFPRLRFGFLEAGAAWVPFLLGATRNDDTAQLFARGRFFLTCEVGEDLPYLLARVGDSAMMVGTDYSHGDRASVMDAHAAIEKRQDLGPGVAERIVSENARAFYGL